MHHILGHVPGSCNSILPCASSTLILTWKDKASGSVLFMVRLRLFLKRVQAHHNFSFSYIFLLRPLAFSVHAGLESLLLFSEFLLSLFRGAILMDAESPLFAFDCTSHNLLKTLPDEILSQEPSWPSLFLDHKATSVLCQVMAHKSL